MTTAQLVLWAMTAMANLAVATFFLRFWWQTAERLFLLFAVAFALFAVNGLWLTLIPPDAEPRHLVYLVRLAGFTLIMIGVIDKNRTRDV
jgi:hypothetical protein